MHSPKIWLVAAIVTVALAGLAGLPAAAQGIHLEAVSVGPVAVHDHVSFNYHLHVTGSPYVDNMKQGYAFDGVDLGIGLAWLWNRVPMMTTFRISPGRRSHFAYDQDTALEPADNATHGDAGVARSWTFGVNQQFQLTQIPSLGRLSLVTGFLRQATQYGQVTTYDLNSDPALPSTSYTRTIGERAILYEIRFGAGLERDFAVGPWAIQAGIEATPEDLVLLHNYIPVILAATSTTAYGADASLAVSHPLGTWRWRLSGQAGEESTYDPQQRFRRETFALRFEFLSPPK